MRRDELKRICSEFRKGILPDGKSQWKCGMVSWALQSYLSVVCGVETKVKETDLGECNHLFLEMQDGTVIDLTADQFNLLFPHKNYPKVYIGKPLDIH